MALLAFRTSTYARNIYIYGTSTFATIDQAYVEEVKVYAANHYTIEQIENAFVNGWITLEEYNQTKELIPA